MGNIISKYVFLPPQPTYDSHLQNLVMIDDQLPALMYECSTVYGSETPYTILFSHGNAEDLGCVASWLKVIRDYCHVNVLAYEYEGYGIHSGEPSEDKIYNDAMRAFKYLTETRKIPSEKIILFGRSLGSGPTIDIAAQLFAPYNKNGLGFMACGCRPSKMFDYDHTKCPAGVVLQSPLSSVIGVVSSTLSHVAPSDMFSNITKMDKVQCPVLIMHGTLDTVVPCEHGKALSIRAPNLWQFYEMQGAGHNDMEENFTNDYLSTLMHFIHALERMAQQRRTQQELAAKVRTMNNDKIRHLTSA